MQILSGVVSKQKKILALGQTSQRARTPVSGAVLALGW